MKIFVVGWCLFLVLSDAVPLKVIPGERKVVKKDGTTHTISRYYVVPKTNYESNEMDKSAPALKMDVLRKIVRQAKRDDSANQLNLFNKGINRQAGKNKRRPKLRTVDPEEWVLKNANTNIMDRSVRVLVEPITIKTDIIVRLNETESSEEGLIESILDATDDMQDLNYIKMKKQENLIMSLFGAEINRKARVNVDNFWKLVKYYIATTPNEVELIKKIGRLSSFLDIYKMLNQKSKRMPIEPVIDDLIGVFNKHKSVKQKNYSKFENQARLGGNNGNLTVKAYADSAQIQDNEPSNILRSELNASFEEHDDVRITFSNKASHPKSHKLSRAKNKSKKKQLNRNEALKNKSKVTTTTTPPLVEAKSEPLSIENISWESQPWVIGDNMENEGPLIIKEETENVLPIDKGTESYVPWLPMPEPMVKQDLPVSVPDTTKQEPLISPSIEYGEPLITEVKTQNDLPWITNENVEHEKPIIIDGKPNEAPGPELLAKYEEPLIIAENTENDSPWITGDWVEYEEPAKKEPLIHHRVEKEKPLIIKETMENDLPWTSGEWVKYDEPSNSDESIKIEPESRIKYEEPLIIPKNIVNNASFKDDEAIKESLVNHNVKHEKPVTKENMDNDMPWISGEWVKYDEPLGIAYDTKQEPEAEPGLKYDIPVVVEENIENDMPWTDFDKPLNDDNVSKNNHVISSSIPENNPLIIEKMLDKFVPWISDPWVKNDVPLGTGDKKTELPVIGSRIKQDEPSNIVQIQENDEPWITFNQPLNIKNTEIELPITENDPLNFQDISDKDMPWVTDEWVKNGVPMSADDAGNGKLLIDSPIYKDNPLNIEKTSDNVQSYPGEWVENFVPLSVDSAKNELPVIGSKNKQDEPSSIGQGKENDEPWITFNQPLNIKNAEIDLPIKENDPFNIGEISDKDGPWVTDEWVKNDVPMSSDNAANGKPLIDSRIYKDKPLNIEKISDNVPWYPGEWVKNDVPSSVEGVKNELPIVGPNIYQDVPSSIGQIKENDEPWITFNQPFSIKNTEIELPITENDPLNIRDISDKDGPWVTDEWGKNGVPMSADNAANGNPLIDSRIYKDKPLNIEKISDNVPWYPGEWVKNDVPSSVEGVKNELSAVGSNIYQDVPSSIGQTKENDEPWITFNQPFSIKNTEIELPITQNDPLNIRDIWDKDRPWVTDEWVKNGVPMSADNTANLLIDSAINEDNPLDIEKISDNVPRYPGEWEENFVPLGVNGIKNEIPVIGPRIKQIKPSIMKESSEYGIPWITYGNPMSFVDGAIEDPGINPGIKGNKARDVPSSLKPLTNEELPWHIEDRKKKDLSWLIDEEAKKILPWTNTKKLRDPYQIYTYVINPPQVSYLNPQIKKIAGMKSAQYGDLGLNNLNDFGLTTAYNQYGNQFPQSYYKSKYSTFQQPSNADIRPGYSQSVISENQSFLPGGSQAYHELELMKSNPTMFQSNTLLNEPFPYPSLAEQNKILSGQQVTYGLENNIPTTKNNNLNNINYQSNLQPNPYGSQSSTVSGNKFSVQSSVNIDVGNNQHQGSNLVAPDKTLRPNMPSNGYEGQSKIETVNVDIGNQQPSSQKNTQNIQFGSQSQMTMPYGHSSNSQVNYNAVNSRPTMQQTSFNNGISVPKAVSSQYQYTQPNNLIRYVNTNGVNPYIYGAKPYLYNSVQQMRPQLAASYQLFSINNLLKLNENLRKTEFNALDANQRGALLNLRKIVHLLLTMANHFAQNGRGNNWYENIFYKVQNNYHPLQPYVYALIRQRWLHELLMILNNNQFSLHVLYNPKILAFLGAWRFPQNVLSFLNTEKLIEEHVDSGISYPARPITPNDNSNQKYTFSEANISNVKGPTTGATSLQIVNSDATAVLDILQKHLLFKKYLQKKEEDVVGENKMVVLKEIVMYLKQKGYGPTIIADLIRKVHGEVHFAESNECHTEYHPDIVHHLYNVIFPVLRRSA